MELQQETYLTVGPYEELLTGIHTALTVNEGIIKVIGGEGAGKTSLCRQLIAELKNKDQDVIFFETPPESSDYLYQRIQSHLGLDKRKNFDRALREYLRAKPAPANKLVIVYDDAEKVDKEIFILMRLLNNIQDETETLISQIICGTPELDNRFNDPELRSLTQYLNQSFILEPMTRAELADFYSGFIKQKQIIKPGVTNTDLTNIYILSKGLPGKSLELLREIIKAGPMEETRTVISKGKAPEKNKKSASKVKRKKSAARHKSKTAGETGGGNKGKGAAGTAKRGEGGIAPAAVAAGNSITKALDAAGEEVHKPRTLAPQPAEQPPSRQDTAGTASANIMPASAMVSPGAGADVPETGRKPAPRSMEAPAESLAAAGAVPAAENQQDYRQEVNEILDRDITVPPPERARRPFYFKAALGIIVVVVTVVLSIILSGDNEFVNERLARILADDSPLYLDEVGEAAPTEGNPPAGNNVARTAGPPETTDTATEADVPLQEGPAVAVQETIASTEEAPAAEPPDAGNETLAPADAAGPENEAAAITAEPGDTSEDAGGQDHQGAESATSGVEGTESMEAVISDAIAVWITSWQSHDVAGYFAAYDENFEPSYQDTIDEWRQDRTAAVARPGDLDISFDRLEITDTGDDTVTVRFWLAYSRSGYADDTWKELLFHLSDSDGNWLIQMERNLEIVVHD